MALLKKQSLSSKLVEKCVAADWLFRCQWSQCLISISVQETSQHWDGLNPCSLWYRNCLRSEKISDFAAPWSFRGIWDLGSLYLTFTPFSSIWNWWSGIGMVSIVFGWSHSVCKYQWIYLRAACSAVWCTPRVGSWTSFILIVHFSTEWYRQ